MLFFCVCVCDWWDLTAGNKCPGPVGGRGRMMQQQQAVVWWTVINTNVYIKHILFIWYYHSRKKKKKKKKENDSLSWKRLKWDCHSDCQHPTQVKAIKFIKMQTLRKYLDYKIEMNTAGQSWYFPVGSVSMCRILRAFLGDYKGMSNRKQRQPQTLNTEINLSGLNGTITSQWGHTSTGMA